MWCRKCKSNVEYSARFKAWYHVYEMWSRICGEFAEVEC